MTRFFSPLIATILLIAPLAHLEAAPPAGVIEGRTLPREALHRSSRTTDIVISEIMYRPGAWAEEENLEFVELYNSGPVSMDLSGWSLGGSIAFTFPPDTVLAARSFLVVAAEPGAVEERYGLTGVLGGFFGSLDHAEGEVRLFHPNGGLMLEAEYEDRHPWPAAAAGAGHSLVLARPSYGEGEREAWEASAVKGGSPGEYEPEMDDPLGTVVINEFLAHTDEPQVDFIELFNHGTETVDLSGAWLSDKPYENRFQIPEGTLLPPGGFLSYDENQLGFALRASGEAVYLVDPEDTRVIDAIRFEAQANGVSMGRYPDGAPDFTLLDTPTPGAPNSGLYFSPVVINEIMFNPISGQEEDTWLELHNRGDEPVDMSDWRFVDGISFVIPDGTVLPAGGYLVIAKDKERMIGRYPQLNETNTVGDFGGRLANSGERLALAMPSPRSAAPTDHVIVDELRYRDGGQWGTWANRDGSSLELRDARADNRLAANWTHSDESAKSEWIQIEHTGVMDHGRGPADQLHLFMPSAGEGLLDNIEVRVGDGPNLVSNGDFDSGFAGWVAQGNHVHTHWHETEGYESDQSMRLVATGGGDTGANRVRINLDETLSSGTTVTLRARARWLAGHPKVFLRLKGNYLEARGDLHVPADLGTPGLPNSAAVANIGPAIHNVRHHPVLPAADEPVRITARVEDPDGVDQVVLWYRVDPDPTYTPVTMRDDGQSPDALADDGIYTAVIPGQAEGQLVAFYIEATDEHSDPAEATFPENPEAYQLLLRFGEPAPEGILTDYRLWFTEAVREEWLTREALSNQRLPGTLVHGNRVIHNIGARHRGSPFRRRDDSFSGYSFQVPRDDRMLGAREFNLYRLAGGRRMEPEPTAQRERTGFWIAEQIGLPFSHQTYIHLRVNGVEDDHNYTDILHVNADYIRAWFPDHDDGELFKGDDWFEFRDDFSRKFNQDARLRHFTTTGGEKKQARYRWNWNKRSNRWLDDDYTSLFGLIDAVNTPGTGAYDAAVNATVDMDQWMRVFAARRVVSDWDGYGYDRGKDAWLYNPPNDTWKIILWDLDKGIGIWNAPPDASLFGADDPVVERMQNHPPFRRAYLRAFREAVNGPLLPSRLHPMLDEWYAALQANGIDADSPEVIKSWMADRRAYIINVLEEEDDPWQPDQESPVSTGSPFHLLEGTAPVEVESLLVNGIPYPVTWTSATAWRMNVPLDTGENTLHLEGLDRNGNLLHQSTLTVTFTGEMDEPADKLRINEIMPAPIEAGTEFVEIHNLSTTQAFDLTNHRLRGVDFNFAPGTTIAPRGFLLVVNDMALFEDHYGPGLPIAGAYQGTLQPQGERLRLVRLADGVSPEQVIDEVNYQTDFPWPGGAYYTGASLQRIDPAQASDHPGNWMALSPDDPSAPAVWQFVSLTARTHPGNPSDRVYIYLEDAGEVHLDSLYLVKGTEPEVGENLIVNGGFEGSLSPWTVSGNLAESSLTTGVQQAGESSLHVVASSGGSSRDSSIWQANLDFEYDETYTMSFWYLPNENGADLTVRLRYSEFISDGLIITQDTTPAPGYRTPGAPNAAQADLPPFPALRFNEIQPQNDGAFTDRFGEAGPWVELYHAGEEPLSLAGYTLSNDPGQPALWAFPEDAVLAPGAHTVVWLDGQPEQTSGEEWHAGFTIDPDQGTVYLFREINQIPMIIDWLSYAAVPSGLSYGRYPEDDPERTQLFLHPTPGQANEGLSTALLHFWHFTDALPNNTPLEEVVASYSLGDPGRIEYTSALAGYPFLPEHQNWRKASMERRNQPTSLNYRPEGNQHLAYDKDTARGLQVRQPFSGDGGENTMVFHMPTGGYENIVFSFAAMDEGAAEGLIVDYSTTADEPAWSTVDLSDHLFDLENEYRLHQIDFSGIPQANDNPHFKTRIRFEADGSADDGNRVTFNNISLDGVAMGETKMPPQLVQPIPPATAVVAQPLTLDLSSYFSDPEDDSLTFHAVSGEPAVVSAEVMGNSLVLTPLSPGNGTITVGAHDGFNPPVETSFHLLVYPAPFALKDGDFLFDTWNSNEPAGRFPENMIFLQSTVSDPVLDTPLPFAYFIPAEDAAEPVDISFPYAASARSRINGLGDDGIRFINTGRGRDLGSALVALDTTGVTEVGVSFTVETVLPNSRIYGLRLQYRTGLEEEWSDLLNEHGEPVEYIRHETEGDTEFFDTIPLPEALEGLPMVQLQWRYHHREVDSGPRAMLRLGDITVTSTRPPSEGFDAWVTEHFDPAEQADPSLSGPLATPLNDGAPNLLKYALGLTPFEKVTEVQLETGRSADGRLYLRFHRDPQKDDLVYVVEASTDLDDWSEGVFDSSSEPFEPNSDGEIHEVSVPIQGNGASPRFLRLRVKRQ